MWEGLNKGTGQDVKVRVGDTMGSIFYGVEFEVCTKPLIGDALAVLFFFSPKDSVLLSS